MRRPNDDPSRAAKWTVLLASIAALAFLAAAAIEENISAEWRTEIGRASGRERV